MSAKTPKTPKSQNQLLLGRKVIVVCGHDTNEALAQWREKFEKMPEGERLGISRIRRRIGQPADVVAVNMVGSTPMLTLEFEDGEMITEVEPTLVGTKFVWFNRAGKMVAKFPTTDAQAA